MSELPNSSCAECGSPLRAEQRYCLECGARRGLLPAAVAARLEPLRAEPAVAPPPPPVANGAEEEGESEDSRWGFMPSPEVAAVVVMALLAAGVVLGSVTSPLAVSSPFAPIILRMGSPAVADEPEAEVAAASASSETAAPIGAAAPPPVPVPVAPVPVAAEPAPESKPLELPPELTEEEELPDVTHVFLVVLEGQGFEQSFGEQSQSKYFKEELPAQGELIHNYYAVAGSSLANQIALLSGQGPTPETLADCPQYAAITPGTPDLEGQVEGSGCIYPEETPTLPAQLTAAKKTWKAYVEGIGGGVAAGEPPTCRHPAPDTPDAHQAPLAGDPYVTWRDPFAYFAEVVETPECGERVVGLDQLDADLKAPKKTPTLSYLVPDACRDGSEPEAASAAATAREAACPEQPAGLDGAQKFLEEVLPKITASQGYKEGGLILVTFAGAPQSGPFADSSSCCATPEYPNLPAPPAPPADAPTGPVKATGGGGHVGLLMISPFVEAGSAEDAAYYNHFSLLLSIEELFELTPPPGYASGAALTALGAEVFNAAS